jgi:hypothetical protein
VRVVRPGGILADITIFEEAEPQDLPTEAERSLQAQWPGVPPVTDPFDNELDDLEDLLSSAVQHANRLRRQVAIKRTQRTATEVSQDYAERLAEKATFRRLLSDEALDGVRFRWWFEQCRTKGMFVMPDGTTLDKFREDIDRFIAKESERG